MNKYVKWSDVEKFVLIAIAVELALDWIDEYRERKQPVEIKTARPFPTSSTKPISMWR